VIDPKRITILLSVLAGFCLPGCTREQAYGTGQMWQRQECSRIPDRAEYDRCMRDAELSYDAYRRETGAERK
jgi:hypothetical protein